MRLLLLALLALPGLAQATPRMSLTAGTPCAACHVNPSGGEGRSELGFGAMHRVGVVTWDQLGLQAFHDVNSNTWLDGAVGFGVDLRMQGARLGRPELVDTDTGTKTEVPDYTWFPMQAQPYLTVKPAAGLTLYGTFLAGPGTLRDEIKRLEATELLLAEDPMARQADVEDEAGRFAGKRKYGSAANLPATRAHKPTDADMGPHNFGGGEARPLPRSMAGKGGTRAFKGKRRG